MPPLLPLGILAAIALILKKKETPPQQLTADMQAWSPDLNYFVPIGFTYPRPTGTGNASFPDTQPGVVVSPPIVTEPPVIVTPPPTEPPIITPPPPNEPPPHVDHGKHKGWNRRV